MVGIRLSTLYSIIKHLHVWLVTISFALFVLRAIWHLSKSEQLTKPWVKIAPHIFDSFLLLTGVTLLFVTGYHQQFPSWLFVKCVTIILYIIFGIISFKKPKVAKITLPLALGFFFTTAYLAINKPLL